MATIDSRKSVTILEDGTIPIEVTCVYHDPCVGALVLIPLDAPASAPGGDEAGRSDLMPYRSDLSLHAGASRPFGITIPDTHRRELERNGHMEVDVNVDLFPTLESLPVDKRSEWTALIFKNLVISSAANGP
jgi:hypothetical protein